jgi:hypothetical protein
MSGEMWQYGAGMKPVGILPKIIENVIPMPDEGPCDDVSKGDLCKWIALAQQVIKLDVGRKH